MLLTLKLCKHQTELKHDLTKKSQRGNFSSHFRRAHTSDCTVVTSKGNILNHSKS